MGWSFYVRTAKYNGTMSGYKALQHAEMGAPRLTASHSRFLFYDKILETNQVYCSCRVVGLNVLFWHSGAVWNERQQPLWLDDLFMFNINHLFSGGVIK